MSKQIKSVCVYCGSSNNVDQAYKDAAESLGRELAENNYNLVYGGGNVGLMGIAASAALASGGEVHGIIPGHIADREVAHRTLTKLDVVDTMHERKQMMVDNSDAFIIMPGGLGTMDEFFEIVTWRQLGLHDKPVIIVNVKGYWNDLVALINHLISEGFARPADMDHLTIVDAPEEVVEALKNARPEQISSRSGLI